MIGLFDWKTVFPAGTVLIVDYKKGPNPFQNVPEINNLPRDNSTMKIRVIEIPLFLLRIMQV